MRHEQSEGQHLEYVHTSLLSIYATSSSCVLNKVLLRCQHGVRCRQYVYWQLVLWSQHEMRCRQYVYWQLVLWSQHEVRCRQYVYWQLVLCSQHEVWCRHSTRWDVGSTYTDRTVWSLRQRHDEAIKAKDKAVWRCYTPKYSYSLHNFSCERKPTYNVGNACFSSVSHKSVRGLSTLCHVPQMDIKTWVRIFMC
jgi:hypothetical protein